MTSLYANRVATTRPPLERRLANALSEALDLLEERAPNNLIDVLREAETKFASIRRREMEADIEQCVMGRVK